MMTLRSPKLVELVEVVGIGIEAADEPFAVIGWVDEIL